MAAPTLEDFKEWLRLPADFTADDVVLQRSLDSGVAAVNEHCGEQAGRRFDLQADPTSWYPTPWGRSDRDGWWCVDIPDLMTTVGLIVVAGGTTLTTDSYRLTPRNAAGKGRPWTGMEVDAASCEEITVTGRWGWTTAPANVQQARLQQSQRFYQRRDSPYGIAGSPDQGGSELRLLSYVDPDVKVLLRGYMRARAVA